MKFLLCAIETFAFNASITLVENGNQQLLEFCDYLNISALLIKYCNQYKIHKICFSGNKKYIEPIINELNALNKIENNNQKLEIEVLNK